MKQCPVCKTTYTDATLRFCLSDGNTLRDLGGEQPTVVRHGEDLSNEETVAVGSGGGQMRVEIPQETVKTPQQPNFQPLAQASGGSSGGLLKVLLVMLGLGIFTVLAVVAGTLIYYNMNRPEIMSNVSNKNAQTPVSFTPSPTTDDKNELRDQVANLEKLINEQKKSNQPANVPLPMPNQSTTTARVNSPGDGFLALRTLPSSEFGERILKIPHGATVSVGSCGPVVKPVARSGRWCQANYNGYSGWVFDAYLNY